MLQFSPPLLGRIPNEGGNFDLNVKATEIVPHCRQADFRLRARGPLFDLQGSSCRTEMFPYDRKFIGGLKLGNVWVFVQQMFGPLWPMNQLKKKQILHNLGLPISSDKYRENET